MELLEGRRILHINSPVRWNGARYTHGTCSNWKVLMKTVSFLPECHHFITVPHNNELQDIYYNKSNITIIPMVYPQSVTLNRAMFDYKPLLKQLKAREHDIDFIFCHQPELLYPILTGLISKRVAERLSSFNFFHWVDSNVSRISLESPEGYFRQLEGIHLSSKSFVHNPISIDYLESNFKNKKQSTIKGINRKELDKKITYMPLSSDIISGDNTDTFFELPKKKILVFNHRWATTTNPQLMVNMTKNLGSDYMIWITDKFAKKPLAGNSIYTLLNVENNNSNDITLKNGTSYRIEKLQTIGEYRYLMGNCFAEICFVSNYATWNMSCQDSIHLGRPSIVFNHPIMKHVLGEGYPFLFDDIEGFERCIQNIRTDENIDWVLPNHDETFKNNLISALCESECITKKMDSKENKTWYKNSMTWMYHILNGVQYKTDLALNTHPLISGTNQWKHIRKYLLSVGIIDDHTSRFTKFIVPKNKRKEIQKKVDDYVEKFGLELIFESVIGMKNGEIGTVLMDEEFESMRTQYDTNNKTFVENDFIKKSLGSNDYKHIMGRIFSFLENKVKPELLDEIEKKFSSKNKMLIKNKKMKKTSTLNRFFK